MQAPVTLTRRVGWAALAAGVLSAVAVGAELVHRVEHDTAVVDRPLFAVYLALYGLGMAALAAAFLGLRALRRAAASKSGRRAGRVGIWLAFSGAVLNVLFAAVHGGLELRPARPPMLSFSSDSACSSSSSARCS